MEGLEKSAFVLLPKSNSMEKKRDKLNFREKRHCRLDDSNFFYFYHITTILGVECNAIVSRDL